MDSWSDDGHPSTRTATVAPLAHDLRLGGGTHADAQGQAQRRRGPLSGSRGRDVRARRL